MADWIDKEQAGRNAVCGACISRGSDFRRRYVGQVLQTDTLELNGYPAERQPLIRKTGLVSLAFAPFGSIPVNMSAITAAKMAGEDAGRFRATRYWAAITSGMFMYFWLLPRRL